MTTRARLLPRDGRRKASAGAKAPLVIGVTSSSRRVEARRGPPEEHTKCSSMAPFLPLGDPAPPCGGRPSTRSAGDPLQTGPVRIRRSVLTGPEVIYAKAPRRADSDRLRFGSCAPWSASLSPGAGSGRWPRSFLRVGPQSPHPTPGEPAYVPFAADVKGAPGRTGLSPAGYSGPCRDVNPTSRRAPSRLPAPSTGHESANCDTHGGGHALPFGSRCPFGEAVPGRSATDATGAPRGGRSSACHAAPRARRVAAAGRGPRPPPRPPVPPPAR